MNCSAPLLRLAVLVVILGLASGCNSSTSSSDTDGSGAATTSSATDDDHASDESTNVLTIGSTAPQLDIADWISLGEGKFSPVSKFEDGKVYIVEFWATWCGPCVASMPHLVAIQEEYADKGLQIISVSDEDRETIDEFLEREYGGEDDGPATYGELTSAYCLTTDPDGSTQSDYMSAAGQNGIPTAFIVGKTGVIEWIGHPMDMDDVLISVINDSWDREAYTAEFEAQNKMQKLLAQVIQKAQSGDTEAALELLQEAKTSADPQTLEELKYIEMSMQLGPVRQAMQSGDYEQALEQLATLRENSDEELQSELDIVKLNVMVEAEMHDEAAAILMASLDDLASVQLNQIAWSIYDQAADVEEINKDLLAAATAAAQKAADSEPENASILDTLSHLLYVGGDLDKAIEVQTKAVEFGSDHPDIVEFLKELKAEASEDKAEDGDVDDASDEEEEDSTDEEAGEEEDSTDQEAGEEEEAEAGEI